MKQYIFWNALLWNALLVLAALLGAQLALIYGSALYATSFVAALLAGNELMLWVRAKIKQRGAS